MSTDSLRPVHTPLKVGVLKTKPLPEETLFQEATSEIGSRLWWWFGWGKLNTGIVNAWPNFERQCDRDKWANFGND
jgi:hypothetical protein